MRQFASTAQAYARLPPSITHGSPGDQYAAWLPYHHIERYSNRPMAAQPRHIAETWFAESVGSWYPLLYAHRNLESAAPEAAFAAYHLNLSANDNLFDLCCGAGRHLAHLAPLVRSATGLDFSPDLLAIASRTLRGSVRLVRADMRHIPFQEAFDAATCFFTSFGYFQNQNQNIDAIREFASSLRTGGRFFIDHVNAAHVRRFLQPRSERTLQQYRVTDERWIDQTTMRVNKQTTVTHGDDVVARFGESVRLYAPGEFLTMLADAGLLVDAMYGAYQSDTPWDSTDDAGLSPRMIAVGKRA